MIPRGIRVAALAVVLGALPAAPLPAQDAAPCLTLADVLRLAGERPPALAVASARRAAATSLARQEAALANPTIEWRREGPGGSPAADRFFTVTQPLDVTGRRLALRAAVGAVDRRASADSLTARREVQAEAARAYWRASLARALLALAAEQRADAERLAATELVRAREGAAAEVSAMRAGLEADRTRFAEATATVEWTRARAELARALAMAPDSLPDVAALAPVAAMPDAVPPLEATLAGAAGARSDLAGAAAGLQAARWRERAANLGVLPDLAIQAGQKRTAGESFGVLALALPFPLWSRNGAARSVSVADRRVAEAERRALEVAVRAEVTAAVEGYRALVAARPAGDLAVAARAAEVARIAEGAHAAGGATLLELLDARRASADARSALLHWTADLRLAQLELARAAGRPLTELPETP